MEEKRLKNLRKIRVPLAAAVLLCFVSAGASLGAVISIAFGITLPGIRSPGR